MSNALRLPTAHDTFLAWEEQQPARSEFDGVRAVAMTGGTLAHAAITGDLHVAIGARLRGGPCRLFSSDVRILAVNTSRYPDAVVTCTAWNNADIVLDKPMVVSRC